jgi:arginine N-succinyltransferase
LFPDGDIYVSLLSPEAQDVIGKVGPQTRGVEKLLRRIGFRYVERIDPFDGGPHFVAPTDEVQLVQRTGLRTVAIGEVVGGQRALVAVEYDAAPWFHAIAVPVQTEGDRVTLSPVAAEHLGLAAGDSAWTLALD